jgi:uncharacterized protein (DUF924 family)
MHQAILDFWFGPASSALRGQSRDEWFRKDAAFDADIAARFGAAIEAALEGGYDGWAGTPQGALALVLLLDQFTRNAFRDTPRAFAGDLRALSIATGAVDRDFDAKLLPVERWFLYMPFEHAESIAAQQRSITLFTRLRDEAGLDGPLVWAQKHAAVIRRFGRYPHRNTILARDSTPEEIAFLAEPGSNF